MTTSINDQELSPRPELLLETGAGKVSTDGAIFDLPRDLRRLVYDHDFNPQALILLWRANVMAHPPGERSERLEALIDSLIYWLAHEGFNAALAQPSSMAPRAA